MEQTLEPPTPATAATGKPAAGGVLLSHTIAGVLIMSVWFGISSMMAVLARKRFGAGDWETLLITAAVPTLLSLSIFWNEMLRQMTIRRYLALHWFCTMLPLACAALARNFWILLACHAIAAVGAAGWSPVSGEVLKRFYPDAVRGRAFGIMNSAVFLGMMIASFVFGRLLDVNEEAFRYYLPVAVASHGAGILMLRRLIRCTGGDRAGERDQSSAPRLGRLLAPVLDMRSVLRGDRAFARYEAAFMTYGAGWMICNALLPVLATDRLHMSYTAFAASTQVIYPLALLLMTYPMGRLLDRIGPTRVPTLSFAVLTVYPLALAAAGSIWMVGAATAVYGVAMAGVHVAWMLGPVSLAPSSDKVAQYVAIHATLVGLRGIVAQGLGMFLYRVTDGFTWPMVVAAFSFAWAAWQMWKLHRLMRVNKTEAE